MGFENLVDLRERMEQLTAREHLIALCLAEKTYQDNVDIAMALGTSPTRIGQEVGGIIARLGVTDRREFQVRYLQNLLVSHVPAGEENETSLEKKVRQGVTASLSYEVEKLPVHDKVRPVTGFARTARKPLVAPERMEAAMALVSKFNDTLPTQGKLSQAEMRIAACVTAGVTNPQEVAAALNVSYGLVRNYFPRIFRKAAVPKMPLYQKRTELIRMIQACASPQVDGSDNGRSDISVSEEPRPEVL